MKKPPFATIVSLAIGLLSASATAADAPPLTLTSLYESARESHPVMAAARLDLAASRQDVLAVERQRWPVMSAVIESDTGSLSATPTHVFRVQQTLWDNGSVEARISESQQLSSVSQLRVSLQEQRLFQDMVSAWQGLWASVERSRVAQETIKNLGVFGNQMKHRAEVGATATIDLALAESRVLQTEVELNSARSGLTDASTRLEQLSGTTGIAVRAETIDQSHYYVTADDFAATLESTDWLDVASRQLIVAKARADALVVKKQLKVKSSDMWPRLYVRVDQPLGTALGSTNTQMSTFLGLQYTPGAGFANLIEAQAIAKRIESLDQSVEAAIREMVVALQADINEFRNARTRIAALERAVKGSELVLKSYERQFVASRKSSLDLLNAVRELGQNKYALADARASLIGARHRLELRLEQHSLQSE